MPFLSYSTCDLTMIQQFHTYISVIFCHITDGRMQTDPLAQVGGASGAAVPLLARMKHSGNIIPF